MSKVRTVSGMGPLGVAILVTVFACGPALVETEVESGVCRGKKY